MVEYSLYSISTLKLTIYIHAQQYENIGNSNVKTAFGLLKSLDQDLIIPFPTVF